MKSRFLLRRLSSASSVAVIPPCTCLYPSEHVYVTVSKQQHLGNLQITPHSLSAALACSGWLGTAFRSISSSRASWTAGSTHANDPAGNIVSFPLAQTGEGISECELMQWFVQEGDVVEEFQPICEVQSDKAAIEITSRHAGTIVKVHHSQGELVKVGAPLIDIQLTTAAAAGAEAEAGGSVDTTTQATAASSSRTSSSSSETDGAVSAAAESSSSVKAAPSVRRLARELGVDLIKVQGSGPDGRILKDDVERFKAGLVNRIADKLVDRIAQTAGPTSTAEMYAAAAEPRFEGDTAAAAAAAAKGDLGVGGGGSGGVQGAAGTAAAAAVKDPQAVTRIPIRGYRRAMIKSATEAAAIPTFHFMDEVCVDGILNLRQLLKEDPSLAGAKLTYLPFIVKALSISLSRFPGLNCSLEPGGQALLQRHSHNIGVAMATGNGLVVPNIKQVEQRSIPEIAQELAHLQHLAAAGKLSTQDVSNGSLTISNIGTVGGTNATPMLYPPEAAIVALGRVQAVPRYDVTGNNIVRRHVMSVSWGGDHRVVDGAAIAEFSNYWKHLLEEPGRLLMHMR